jgi:pimeloyl-ACP methyl ester carboxylesterase
MLARTLALAAALALGGLADRLIYHPMPVADGWSAEKAGIAGAEECSFAARDGTRLSGLHIAREGARASVLYLHGNAGNLTHWVRGLARVADRARVNVLLLDYRGYGKSRGAPSEEGLYEDAEAAFDHLLEAHGARAERLVIYGHSLGTGVGTELALRRHAAGLILEAPFTSVVAVAQRAVPSFVKIETMLSERYDNLAKAPRLALPLLVVHGTADRTCPFDMGRAVFAAAPEPKRFLEVAGAGHLDAPERAGERFWTALDEFLEQALPRGAAAGRAPALY